MSKNIVRVIAQGKVGSGKSAILGEIEIALRAIGVTVKWIDEEFALAEKNMTHADWSEYIELYNPTVVLIEELSDE